MIVRNFIVNDCQLLFGRRIDVQDNFSFFHPGFKFFSPLAYKTHKYPNKKFHE